MDFWVLCFLQLRTRNIANRWHLTIYLFLNIILGAFMSVQRCWLLLYVPRRRSKGKDPFSVWDVLCLPKRKERKWAFSSPFSSLSGDWLLRSSWIFDVSKTFFLIHFIRRWNENSRQSTGSFLQSPQRKPYTEKKSVALLFWFLLQVLSCHLLVWFFLGGGGVVVVVTQQTCLSYLALLIGTVTSLQITHWVLQKIR